MQNAGKNINNSGKKDHLKHALTQPRPRKTMPNSRQRNWHRIASASLITQSSGTK